MILMKLFKIIFNIILLIIILNIVQLVNCNEDEIKISIIPIVNNEDGTYYPGDSFLIKYSIPSNGTFHDNNGNLCNYYYTLEKIEISSECIDNINFSNEGIICTIANISPGIYTVNIIFYINYHYQYWLNETYPIYDNGSIIGYYWKWTSNWDCYPLKIIKSFKLEIVEYDPNFTIILYPVLKGEAITTYRMDLALLLRYDGNGHDHNLKQRAIIDQYSVKTIGKTLFFINSSEDLQILTMNGFYDIRPITSEDIISNTTSWIKSITDIILNRSSIYIAYKDCSEYGPIAKNFYEKIFTSKDRYAKFLFSLDYNIEKINIEELNINILVYWSRFPSINRTSSIDLPYLKIRMPINIIPPSNETSILITKIYNDIFFNELFNPPENDEWFIKEWNNDYINITSIFLEINGSQISILIPRTLSCFYNFTIINTNNWIPIYIDFNKEEFNIDMNLKAYVNNIKDYYSWFEINITSNQILKKLSLFYIENNSKIIFYDINYIQSKDNNYYLWIKKPQNIYRNTTIYAEIIDIWGNSKVLEIGVISPYNNEILNDRIFLIVFITIGLIILYKSLRKFSFKFLKLI